MKKKEIFSAFGLVALFLVVGIFIISWFRSPQLSPVFPDDKVKISKVKWLICNLTARGFSDWVYVDSTTEVPYQAGDFRNPADYATQINPPSIERTDDHSVVTLYTWNEDGGLLSRWKATIEDDEVVFLRAEVIQVAVGHHTPLSTEGRFLPTEGALLVNENPSGLNIGSEPSCQRYQIVESTTEEKGSLEKEMVRITGRPRLAGNEPFVFLAFETEEGVNYSLTGEKQKIAELRKLAGKGGEIKLEIRGYVNEKGKLIEVINYRIIGGNN